MKWLRGWRLTWRWQDLWVGARVDQYTDRWVFVAVVPTVVLHLQLGDPTCYCTNSRDDGRHIPASECGMGGGDNGCPDPRAHHAYRAAPWWRRRVAWSPLP